MLAARGGGRRLGRRGRGARGSTSQPAATASGPARPLDDERTFLGTRTAAPEEAPQSLDSGLVNVTARHARSARSARSLERGLGRLDEAAERGRVGDGEIGEDLAVDLDAGGVQPGDEPAVAHVVEAARRVDPLDPQAAELALAGPAVAEGVLPAAHDLLVGRPERAALVAVVALGLLQYLLVALLGSHATLHPCHVTLSLRLGRCR